MAPIDRPDTGDAFGRHLSCLLPAHLPLDAVKGGAHFVTNPTSAAVVNVVGQSASVSSDERCARNGGALGKEKSLAITAKALRACGCNDREVLERDPSAIARNVVELDLQHVSMMTRRHINQVRQRMKSSLGF